MFDSEQAVIGAILLEPRCLGQVREQKSLSDFRWEAGRAVFAAACALADAGQDVSPVTIKARAAEDGATLEDRDLLTAMQLAPVAGNLPTYLQGMQDDSLRRELLDAVSASYLHLSNGEPPQLVCAELQTVLQRAAERENSRGVVSSEEAFLAFADHRVEIESGKKRAFVSTGFTPLDNALGGGFVPQSLNILAARPGCGKTTFALQLAEKAAAAGTATLFISLEMPNDQLAARRLAVDTGMPAGRILNARLLDDETERVTRSMDKLHSVPLYFSRENRADVGKIGLLARQVKGCGLVVVDYLGLLCYEQGRTLYEQVTKTSNALKRLALSLGMPILCLCQLNREVEARKGSPPRMSDLRDSGAIEQDADSVLLLHRPVYQAEDGPVPLSCTVGKNRHGPAGRELCFNWYMDSGRIIPAMHERPAGW